MIVKNEMFFLQRHIHLVSGLFDGVIAADANSTDGTKRFLTSLGATVMRQSHPDMEEQDMHRNDLMREAERQGYDWLMMLDADEAMFREGIEEAKRFMEAPDTEFLAFPRIEFYGDTNHYLPNIYPDIQGRAIKLRLGYEWRNPIHEIVWKDGDASSAFDMKRYTLVPRAHIFHYGWALDFERHHKRYFASPTPDPFANPDLKVYYGKQPV